ncbi:type I-F CRISPR-associated protein Csy2 [Azotobacter armeniacus]
MTRTTALLLLPRLHVQNANAVSGPLSWGFPAPSAFTGFAHALQRRLAEYDVRLGGVGIVCHSFEPQTFQPPGRRTQVFRLTRNPLDKDGGSPALVEEGRVHLKVSLVIEVLEPLDEDLRPGLAAAALEVAHGMRLAGGSILPQYGARHAAELIDWYATREHNAEAFRRLRRRLLPGFALVARDDLLAAHLQELRAAHPDGTALDALLDLSRLNVEPGPDDPQTPGKVLWSIRGKPGWLVPLPVGYAALSELHATGSVANARDGQTPFRFVESLYSLGEWVSPHRLGDLQQLLWRHHADPKRGLYRCINTFSARQTSHKENA